MATIRITIVILKSILNPKFLLKDYTNVLQSKSCEQKLDSFCYQSADGSPKPPEWLDLIYIPEHSQVPIGTGISLCVSPLYLVTPLSSWAVILVRPVSSIEGLVTI